MNYEDILDTSWLRLEGDFDSQVQEVLRYVRLTADRVYNLKHLFDDIEEALRHLAPGCQIMPFGSVVTGLGIKTSDADVFVALPEGHHPTVNHVVQARNMLHRYHRKFTQLFAITKAKVPIVKFFSLVITTNSLNDMVIQKPEITTSENAVVNVTETLKLTNHTDGSGETTVTKQADVVTVNAETVTKNAETLTKNVESFFKNAESLLASAANSSDNTAASASDVGVACALK